ncbi:hypothetical protein KAJ27_02360 [bacterium]|nr:hypothetical protein [bacterium]
MSENEKNYRSDEVEELKKEIDMFMKEKERVRSIIGQIGGVPHKSEKIVNAIFLIILIGSVIFSIILGGDVRMVMIELAVFLLSIKIIYLIHNQSKVNHFQLWILSSIEWRMNESSKKIDQIHKHHIKNEKSKENTDTEKETEK